MMALPISTQYTYTGRGPFDSKSLVKTYTDLTNADTWTHEGNIVAYNGMIVAVWLDTDASKNGIYYLFDATVKSTRTAPDVTSSDNWIKMSGNVDLSDFVSRLEEIEKNLAITDATVSQHTEEIAVILARLDEQVQVKSSDEVNVAEDGTLTLEAVSTDKLVQGTKILVLDGGTV